MAELIEFLRARLDEDERIAIAASGCAMPEAQSAGDRWRLSDGEIYPSDRSRHPGSIITGWDGWFETGHGEHVARHDPARVLAEVNAKRRILDEIVPQIIGLDWQIISEWGSSQNEPDEHLPLLKLLALPYADHPGYCDGWRP